MQLALLLACALGQTNVDAKTMPIRFPSKREIKVQVLPGRYRSLGNAVTDTLSYTETTVQAGIVNAVVMVSSSTISCRDQESALHDGDVTVTVLSSGPMKALGAAFYVRWPQFKNTRWVREVCLPRKNGSITGTIDDPVTDGAWPDLEPVLVAMLATRK